MKTHAPGTVEEVIARLRARGAVDERLLEYIALSLQPGGEERILPGETRAVAVARLVRHYGWDERTAEFTISLAEGWSDVVPEDDDGTPLPYFRVRDEDAGMPEPGDEGDPR